MRKFGRKCLAAILTLAMLITFIPAGAAPARAAGEGENSTEGYTIDYAEETITIGEGYEVYTAETGGDKIESGGSITAYIGQTLYIQQTGSETTGRTAISIPVRPQAPEISGINISYSTEKLTIPSNAGFSADDLEYTTQGYQTVRKWTAVPESLSLSEMGWTGNQMYIYFRIKATETSFASEATTTGMQIPSRPTAPTSESIWTVRTEKSITISGVSGQEYRCGIGDDWARGKPSAVTVSRLNLRTWNLERNIRSKTDINLAQMKAIKNSSPVLPTARR